MPTRGEVVDLLAHPDPIRAFFDARSGGRLIGLRTSGTTGAPRMVVRSAESWTDSFGSVSHFSGIDDRARVWVPGPVQATMNLFARVHATAVDATLVDDASEATHAHLTPTALARALDDGRLQRGVTVIVAGDALPPATRHRAVESGAAVHSYYGASELSFVGWATDGSTLRLFPGVEGRVINDVIWVRSPYLSLGYAEDTEGGAMRRDDAGFATVGDRGSLVDDVVTVWGRGDEAITTAGATVMVADVERVLRDHARGEVVVVGVPHDLVGHVVVGVVTETGDAELLGQVARERLGAAQRPRTWRVVDALPMTKAGKVDREALTRMLTDGPST